MKEDWQEPQHNLRSTPLRGNPKTLKNHRGSKGLGALFWYPIPLHKSVSAHSTWTGAHGTDQSAFSSVLATSLNVVQNQKVVYQRREWNPEASENGVLPSLLRVFTISECSRWRFHVFKTRFEQLRCHQHPIRLGGRDPDPGFQKKGWAVELGLCFAIPCAIEIA